MGSVFRHFATRGPLEKEVAFFVVVLFSLLFFLMYVVLRDQ